MVPVLRALGSLAGMLLPDVEEEDSMRALRWIRSKEKPEGAAVEAVGARVNSDMVFTALDVLRRRRRGRGEEEREESCGNESKEKRWAVAIFSICALYM